MYSLFSILILIVCFLLVLIVLVQNSKGGGLASNFSGAGQVMGVRKTADFLEKSTWTLAIALVIFSIVAVAAIPRAENGAQQSRIQEQVQHTTTGLDNMPPSPENAKVQNDGSDATNATTEQSATPSTENSSAQ